MSRIFIINGADKGRSFELKGDLTYVGRAPENDIQLKDRSISRKHLQIQRKGDEYSVKDLKTTNGTFVLGRRIPAGKEFQVLEGQPIAVGNVFFSLGRPYSGDDQAVQALIDLSNELGVGLEKSARDRPMTLAKNMGLVSRVSEILMESLSVKELVEKFLRYVFDLLERLDRGVIILTDQETGRITEVIPGFRESGDDTVMMYSRTVVERVLKEGRPVSMADTVTQGSLSDSMEVMKIRSVLCVPLISRSRIRGVVYVDSITRPYGFRKDDVELLAALASSAAVAIENALLHASLENGDEGKTRDAWGHDKKTETVPSTDRPAR